MKRFDQPGQAFEFYNTYLSVIYGLIVTDALPGLVTLIIEKEEQSLRSINFYLFVGTFLTSARLWLVSARVDEVFQQFYCLVGRSKWSRLEALLLLDTLVATIFAGFLLAMFTAITKNDERNKEETIFFLAFLLLIAISVLYDGYLKLVGFLVRRSSLIVNENDSKVVSKYDLKIGRWIQQDLAFALLVAVGYCLDLRMQPRGSVKMGLAFVAVTILQLFSRFAHFQPFERFYRQQSVATQGSSSPTQKN
jgi:hypothetical protein